MLHTSKSVNNVLFWNVVPNKSRSTFFGTTRNEGAGVKSGEAGSWPYGCHPSHHWNDVRLGTGICLWIKVEKLYVRGITSRTTSHSFELKGSVCFCLQLTAAGTWDGTACGRCQCMWRDRVMDNGKSTLRFRSINLPGYSQAAKVKKTFLVWWYYCRLHMCQPCDYV